MESKFLLHPRWQVCVIDARHFGRRSHFRELEKLQLETASHYCLSHTSALTEKDEHRLIETVKGINPGASRTSASALADALSQGILQGRNRALVQAETKPGLPPAPHLHDRHQLAHEFTGCNIIFPKAVEPTRVTTWLERLPVSVIRAKALINLRTDPDRRYLYERVGLEVEPNPIPVRSIDKVPCSGLFIGPDLEPDQILQLTRETLHSDCHFPEK